MIKLYICTLINISFISFQSESSQKIPGHYRSTYNYPIESNINTKTIYETNPFLLKIKNTTLIEYAAFFGSIQIFKYLRMNKAKMLPTLWFYAIHSHNAEIIQLLEENNIRPKNRELIIEFYKDCLKESIKCHHNDIFEYIKNNFFETETINLDDIKLNYLCLALIENIEIIKLLLANESFFLLCLDEISIYFNFY